MNASVCSLLCLLLSSFLPLSALKAEVNPEITFVTDWKAQAEHGGFYQALALGLYEKHGINVKIRPGGPQTDNPRLMAAGVIDIAMASNNFQPVNLNAAGAPVTIVMTSFQKDPQILMVHPEVGATSFKDLKGMPIFMSDSAIATFWPWLKSRFGYTDQQIRKYTYSLAPWLVNKNSVQEGYLSSEPFSAEQAGVKPTVLLFADAGFPGYSGMVMVRSAFLKDNKETVQAFVAASIEGWQRYIWDDPSPGNALILADNPEMTKELLAFSIATMKKNNMLGQKEKVGCMQKARWALFLDQMKALNLVSGKIPAQTLYTNRFMPHCSEQD